MVFLVGWPPHLLWRGPNGGAGARLGGRRGTLTLLLGSE